MKFYLDIPRKGTLLSPDQGGNLRIILSINHLAESGIGWEQIGR
jgi:hypothetical protein